MLEPQDAIALGVSGPTLRAAGVAYDVRKFFPYSSYEEFDFDVPTRTEADCYARYLVRVAEMRESLKIVRQAMGKIPPEGPIKADAPGIVPPQREEDEDGDGSADLPFQDFHRRVLRRRRARSTSASNRRAAKLGFFVASDGSPKPYRVKVRAPSFVNLQALPKLAEGSLVADLIACIGTIDIVLGEVDR